MLGLQGRHTNLDKQLYSFITYACCDAYRVSDDAIVADRNESAVVEQRDEHDKEHLRNGVIVISDKDLARAIFKLRNRQSHRQLEIEGPVLAHLHDRHQ